MAEKRTCSNCATQETSLWYMMGDADGNIECTACYTYFRLYGIKRPQAFEEARMRNRQQLNGTSEWRCANCGTTETGAQKGDRCEACHWYLRKHGCERPKEYEAKLDMKKRKRRMCW